MKKDLFYKIIDGAVGWLCTTKFLSWVRKTAVAILGKAGIVVCLYRVPDRRKVFNLISEIKHETEMLLRWNEAYQVFVNVKNTAKIEGDTVEVGTYRGGSAKLICEAKGDKTLHLFDTFEGLPEIGEIDTAFQQGQFKGALEEVQEYLKEYENVHFYEGVFPSTAEAIKNRKFSFVHIDVDLYESVMNSLCFFYERMNPGAVLISHDYIGIAGGKKAFDEFFKDKQEPIIELPGQQCLIVKL